MHPTPFGNKKGALIIEILIVTAVIAVTLGSLLELANFSLMATVLLGQNARAAEISKNGLEAARNFRDGTDWTVNGLGTLACGMDYFPQAASVPSVWQMIPGVETVGGFQRKIIIEEVRRDASGNMVSSGGTVDPDSKKIRSLVSWQEGSRNHVLELVTYLTNWKR